MDAPAERRDERGYALLATLLVVVAALALVAAVVAPSLVTVADTARLEQARTTLLDLTDSPDRIVRFEDEVNTYPAALSQLSSPVTTADTDLCGRTYSNGQVGSWAGPYVDRVMPATGTPVGIGVAGDSLDYVEVTNQVAHLTLPVRDVRVEDAEALALLVDGAVDPAGGRVRWDAPTAEGLVLLRWTTEVGTCPGGGGGGGGPGGGPPGQQ